MGVCIYRQVCYNRFEISVRRSCFGTEGAAGQAASVRHRRTGDSDIVFDPQIVEKLLDSDKADILALNRHELGEEEIKVIVDDAQKVVEISKVCSISDAIGESIGIEKMSVEYTKALFRELEIMITTEGLDNIFYERAFERLIPQGYSFYVMDTTEFFSAELDTVEDFQQAQKLIPASLY